jgi:cyclophilin family peptidyl-prolyl cis-trans isomerase
MPITPLDFTDPLVTVKTTQGSFTLELFSTKTPVTVKNFLSYSNNGFYTDTIFHRVIDGFMVQAGQTVVQSISGTSLTVATKSTAAPIVLESQAGLSNTRGTIAMARTGVPDSATSQFFVNTVDNSTSLDYKSSTNPGYAVFGTVLQGMDTIDKISKIPVVAASADYQNFPTTLVTILSTKNAIISGVGQATDKAEVIFGTSNNDTLVALAGNDDLQGDSGNDNLDGGTGIDTAVYQGLKVDYTIAKSAQSFQVTDATTARDGSDLLTNIERLSFSDKSVALDIDGNAGQAYRLYQAAFNRTPDLTGLGYWINQRDKGVSDVSVASNFLNSAEFQALVSTAPTANTLVTAFYNNVLHRAPDQAGLDYWVNNLNSGQLNNAQLLISFSESTENQLQVIGSIQNGIDFIG